MPFGFTIQVVPTDPLNERILLHVKFFRNDTLQAIFCVLLIYNYLYNNCLIGFYDFTNQ